MAANYNLYDGINTGSLKSSAESLKAELKSKQSELESFKGGVEGSTWKSDDNSKKTLTDGYEKIITNAYTPLLEKLDNVTTVCAKIEEYREARKTAKQNKSDLSKAKEDPLANFNEQAFLDAISGCEKIMNDCESAINSICGR